MRRVRDMKVEVRPLGGPPSEPSWEPSWCGAQLVPCMPWGTRKPESARPSRGTTAAKAVRTATKLGHRVTERYGAGY